jgi:hypothetical protein
MIVITTVVGGVHEGALRTTVRSAGECTSFGGLAPSTGADAAPVRIPDDGMGLIRAVG